MSDIYILGIETSCDETAAAVVKNGRGVLSNIIYSQDELHERYGGIVPEIASRNHLEKISPCVDAALDDAGMTLDGISAVAVTYAPGLVGALLVGVNYAKTLAFAKKKPLVGVNHTEGHICANFVDNPDLIPPFLCLVASGGHTSLYLARAFDKYDQIGRTLDDAAGEAFDKTARALGLGYPGGRRLEELAKSGNADAYSFPRAINQHDNYDFSFSGLKSAALNLINAGKADAADIAASFQKAVVDTLVKKTVAAALKYEVKTVAIAGGVAANGALRGRLAEECDLYKLSLNIPAPVYCTDNAVMIAARGYYDFIAGRFAGYDLNARSRG